MRLIVTTPPIVSTNRVRELMGYEWDYLVNVADNSGRLYKPFDIRELGDKKWRHIDNPNSELKKVQSRLLERVLRLALLPDYMFGAVRGRDIIGHAKKHIGQPTIVAIDLRDCFPRTHDLKVFDAFRTVFGCSPKIAAVFTKLTTYQHRVPQGAPSSPYMAQLAMLAMVREIEAICAKRGLLLSIYVDDIVFSGRGASYAVGEILDVLKRHGHRIRNRKKRIMHVYRGDEAVITGVKVGVDRLGPPQEYEDRLIERFKRDALESSITAAEDRSIRGQVAYVARLNPKLGELYQSLKDVLPRVAGEGKRSTRVETQPCRRAWEHEYTPSNGGRALPRKAVRPNLPLVTSA